jgi:hypothetical protein
VEAGAGIHLYGDGFSVDEIADQMDVGVKIVVKVISFLP